MYLKFNNNKHDLIRLFTILMTIVSLTGCSNLFALNNEKSKDNSHANYYNRDISEVFSTSINDILSEIPKYNGEPYAIINNNIPFFSEKELTDVPFEYYSDLDELGRCGYAYANICREIMPTEARKEIGSVKPSGWQTVKYSGIIDGNYLYNRCHLIGFQLAGENANEKNLITGTRYFNTEGMLPFENIVANYIEETNNHVLYRVTPIFDEQNLVASGVIMEAKSVEDNGKSVSFNVFVYNVQPGIKIDYLNGDSWEDKINSFPNNSQTTNKENTYIININSKKFHTPNCSSVEDMKKENKKKCEISRDKLLEQGYIPCKKCNP